MALATRSGPAGPGPAVQAQFLHITDTHLVAPGEALYGLDPLERLRRVLGAMAARHAAPGPEQARFVLHTGDVAHAGAAPAYDAFAEVLAGFALPVHCLIGNHDDREAMLRALPAAPRDPAGFVQGVVDGGAFRLLLLDTHVPGRPYGELCEARLAWLAARLAEDARPVLLAMHHPSFATGLQRMDCISLAEPERLWEVLAPHRARLRHLFFGHLHRPIAGSWRGIPVSTLRGTAHQVAFDLVRSWRLPVPGSDEPAAYGVVRVSAECVVVHQMDVLDEMRRFDLSPVFIAEGAEPAWLVRIRPELLPLSQPFPVHQPEQESAP